MLAKHLLSHAKTCLRPVRHRASSLTIIISTHATTDILEYNGQSHLAKGDITQLIMTSGTSHSYLVNIFYHIRQVAARVAKLVLGCT